MKDTKKVTPKKTTKSSYVSSKTKVKDVEIEENFFDDDDKRDKRIIVFAVIAILVILATIVTLVVGCDKKEQEEPPKPVDPIVIPEDKDDKEDEGVETREIVRKVAAVYTGERTTEDDSEKEEPKTEPTTPEEEPTVHTVTFDYGDDNTVRTEEVEVEDGKTVDPFVPKGTTNCYYFPDKTWEEEYDFTTPITGDTVIYTTCEILWYHISYEPETANLSGANPEDWDIYEDDFTLVDGEGEEEFQGWYADETHQNPVEELNADTVDKYGVCDENNYCTLTLYAKFGPEADSEDPDGQDDPNACTEGVDCIIADEDDKEECPEGQTCDLDDPDDQDDSDGAALPGETGATTEPGQAGTDGQPGDDDDDDDATLPGETGTTTEPGQTGTDGQPGDDDDDDDDEVATPPSNNTNDTNPPVGGGSGDNNPDENNNTGNQGGVEEPTPLPDTDGE